VLGSAAATLASLISRSVDADAADGWVARYPEIADRVRARGVLMLHLLVPLCHEDQIACGGMRAGDPDDLAHNLYWGAVFGHDRFLSRKASKMRRIGGAAADGHRLARATFSQSFDGAAFGRATPFDLVIVLDAHHGDAIDDVIDRFFVEAEQGANVSFSDASGARVLPVDVVGYAGHNRMLDGKVAPPQAPEARRHPIPSFVLACRSHQTFAAPLASRGSRLLVAARDLMAPEGYVVEAIALGLVRNESAASLRRRAVNAYAKWQSIEPAVAGTIFAPAS